MRIALLLLAAFLLPACGGGGGSSSGGGAPADQTGTPDGNPSDPSTLPQNPGPQIALLLSNGFSPAVPNYLDDATGPQLQAALVTAGYTVGVQYFTDSLTSWNAFVAELQRIRDEWIVGVQNPTRVVIVAHSYGCVRAHAAIRAVSDCPVALLVDLDASSVGWTGFTHGADNASMGGAPEGAYALGVQITCPTSGVLSAGGAHDLEDVVFDNVVEGYEVRSGDQLVNPANITQLVEYDERWNARLDGSTTGLTCHFSGTPHGEVALAGGTTMAGVQAWILARLAAAP